jgi:iron(III) transport system substrate-binding protein
MTLCLVLSGCGGEVPEPTERPPAPPVVVYAARDADAMRAVSDAYTDNTGITVLLTTEAGRSLVDRMIAEKHRATADLVLVDSIGHLWRAAEADVLRPSRSETLESNVPAWLRDPDRQWFGLLAFARTIAYDKREIDPHDLSDYVALGDDRWRGEICLSSAAGVDNQSHIAMMIRELGERPTELALRAWVSNFAVPVVRDDAELLRAIEDGRCSLGIVNSDDLARFRRDNPDSPVAGFLPPAASGGSYVDIVAAAVTRHANNPAGALRLLEWLSSDSGQKILAGEDLEVPVHQLNELNALQIAPIDLASAGYYRENAINLMERAHYGRAQ